MPSLQAFSFTAGSGPLQLLAGDWSMWAAGLERSGFVGRDELGHPSAVRWIRRLRIRTGNCNCKPVGFSIAGAGAGQMVQAAPLQPAFWACNRGPDLDFNDTYGTRIPNCCSHAELMRVQEEPEHKTWQQYLEQNPLPREPRVRLAAHLAAANETYIRQLDLAYRLQQMNSDPRSQLQQMNFHCIYGVQGVTPQAHAMDLMYVVHSNWLFFPFHRWFTFFYERTLAKLVGDDSFAVPFWNWDNQSEGPDSEHLPHAIPGFMSDPDRYPGLYNKYRDARHRPGAPRTMVNLIRDSVVEDGYSAYSPEEMAAQRAINNAHLHEMIVERTADGQREPFLSYPMRAGGLLPEFSNLRDTFESQPHIALHLWVGDRAYSYADMGVTYHAVRDPLFFVHHTNVDRLWNVWLGLEGRSNFDDPDFLDASFYFYDENGEVVKVTVRDCLHSDLLGYTYQHVDKPLAHLQPFFTRPLGSINQSEDRSISSDAYIPHLIKTPFICQPSCKAFRLATS